MRPTFHVLVTLALGLAVAGCALNPPPTGEEIRRQSLAHVTAPPGWTARGGIPGVVNDDWVSSFRDTQLDALVREALLYNLDLGVAAARVEQATAYAKLAGYTLYPAVNFGAHGGGKMGGDGSGISGAGLFVNWELDLWGRVRAEREAGRLQYESAVADAEYARQSIAALVAKAWVLAIEARLQGTIAADIVRASEQATGLARDRLRVGRGDEYDVTLAQSNLEIARDTARQIALAHEQALRALESLVGRYPAGAVDVAIGLPALPGAVPVGLPSVLLERRPDVSAAERRVAAAFDRVQEAKAAQLPRISLTASLTSISSDLLVLQNHSNPMVSLGANLTAPIFNGYALQSQVAIRTAEQQLAVAEYGRIAARAFGEVEAALSAGFAADEREAILARAVASNARTLELAQVRYKVGSGDLRAVLQQGVALYGARTALLRVQSERLIQRVNLHLALGGGFDSASPVATIADRLAPSSASTGEIAVPR
jgi:NodT family efflux transporter outer membrane factor (OMF) lipoprotein